MSDARLDESGYERKEKEAYFSFDNVIGDDLMWTLNRVHVKPEKVLEPCAGRGDLVRQLKDYKLDVDASDLHNHGVDMKSGVDVLRLTKKDLAPYDLIVTNPPFKSPSAESVALSLYSEAPHAWIALLLPVLWLTAKNDRRREILMQGGRLHCVTFLGRRPVWEEAGAGEASPKQDFMWVLWRPKDPETQKPPFMMWAPVKEKFNDPFA